MLTAVAVMKLVEEGKLKLDDRVAPIIADLKPVEGATVDPRWEQVTIRNLLNHSGGWDRDKPGGFDPIDRTLLAAAAVGAPSPASPETMIRYMKGMPFDFNPGEKWSYSNFGYMILGRVIERLSGMAYEDYVRSRVLQPVGATRTREGRSRLSQAALDEVKYYEPGQGLHGVMVPSVFAGEGIVPLAYGGYYLEISDASGAWISSTIDLLRFLGHIDGRGHGAPLLGPDLMYEMTGHGFPLCPNNACFYGAGFWVKPFGTDATWYHGGDLPGATSLVVRTYHNYSWVGLFNSNSGGAKFDQDFDATMGKVLEEVTFPSHDLFPTFK
jgi:N-acyl-D-amino-acid deacylase